MSDDKQPFAELIRRCEQLLQLLRDPHPGLSTWHEAVHRVRKQIWEYSSTKDESKA